jgi:hypothetical protein
MPALTRRRSKDARAEGWPIFYGDVQVGTIGIRAGVPVGVDWAGAAASIR